MRGESNQNKLGSFTELSENRFNKVGIFLIVKEKDFLDFTIIKTSNA